MGLLPSQRRTYWPTSLAPVCTGFRAETMPTIAQPQSNPTVAASQSPPMQWWTADVPGYLHGLRASCTGVSRLEGWDTGQEHLGRYCRRPSSWRPESLRRARPQACSSKGRGRWTARSGNSLGLVSATLTAPNALLVCLLVPPAYLTRSRRREFCLWPKGSPQAGCGCRILNLGLCCREPFECSHPTRCRFLAPF